MSEYSYPNDIAIGNPNVTYSEIRPVDDSRRLSSLTRAIRLIGKTSEAA